MSGKYKKDVGAIVHKEGVSFRVWAPFADSVALIGSFNNWSEQPMDKEPDGYWYTLLPDAVVGQEYKFVIHRGEERFVRNDPRALHYTTTAGSSVIVDPEFDWQGDNFTAPPVEQQVIYELHVGTFYRPDQAITGTFQDVIAKLNHLAELGVNMIELLPICSMVMDRGWGYAPDYIFAIESLYGGRYAFLKFVAEAHRRGIGVIVDVVYNHLGPDSNLDLWCFDGWNTDNYGGIYFYNDWRAETPWGNTRPDYGRQEVRQYILDNIKMWAIDCHVDGLRVDSTIFIRNVKGHNDDPSTDLPEGWYMLQEINNLVDKMKPSLITIAEDVGDNEYLVKPVQDGGAGFSAQWELGFPFSLRSALNKDSIDLTGVCSELTRRFDGNVFKRVVFADSHDSAANGSARLNEVIAPGKADGLFARQQSLLAAAIILTAPGIPMLFQGQEFMQAGAFNDWQALDWQNAEDHHGIVEAYKHLIALRKNSDGNANGLTGHNINLIHVDEENKVLAYHRWINGGPQDDVVVVINFNNHLHKEYVMGLPRNGTWKVRFNSTWRGYSADFKNIDTPDVVVDNGNGTLVIPPNSALILSQDS
ncbi:MAG TPA: alpha-amylase family glycosyl hydrolase [Candidatus Saccharimonadales bacterium]|nr:alpha-amylase family glycosyl hydrolase [Candidatus Saccharimonadales bacterium]